MKKIIALYNRQGEIISAGHMERPAADVNRVPPREFGVRPGSGQKVAELELTAEHEKFALHELIEKLQVDVKAKKPILRLRKTRPR